MRGRRRNDGVWGAAFWAITTNEGRGAHEYTHGISSAPSKGYASSYHQGVLALFRALESPKDGSYQWKNARPGDICAAHIGGDGKPLASLARRRNTPKLAIHPAPPGPATSGLARNASRASGFQTEEGDQEDIGQLNLFSVPLRSFDPSHAYPPVDLWVEKAINQANYLSRSSSVGHASVADVDLLYDRPVIHDIWWDAVDQYTVRQDWENLSEDIKNRLLDPALRAAHARNALRAGGDQVDEGDVTDDDDGIDADNTEPTRQGESRQGEGEAPGPGQQSAHRSTGAREESEQNSHRDRSTDQNLEHLMAISSTERS